MEKSIKQHNDKTSMSIKCHLIGFLYINGDRILPFEFDHTFGSKKLFLLKIAFPYIKFFLISYTKLLNIPSSIV